MHNAPSVYSLELVEQERKAIRFLLRFISGVYERDPSPTPDPDPQVTIPTGQAQFASFVVEFSRSDHSTEPWVYPIDIDCAYNGITHYFQGTYNRRAGGWVCKHNSSKAQEFIVYFGDTENTWRFDWEQYKVYDPLNMTMYIHNCDYSSSTNIWNLQFINTCYHQALPPVNGIYYNSDIRRDNAVYSLSSSTAQVESNNPKFWIIGKAKFQGDNKVIFTPINILTNADPSSFL